MAKRRPPNSYFSNTRNKSAPAKQVQYLLEQTDLASLRKAKQVSEELARYHWKYYYELAQQRNEIIDQIKSALLQNIIEKFSFQKWQRAVKWKYSLHPLCTIGSQTFIGQRFNFGDEINSEIHGFPCLYLASDKNTALQETLGQSAPDKGLLSSQEIALSNPQSESMVSISGQLDQIIDLRNSAALKDFVKLVKNFSLSKDVKELAKKFGDTPNVITTPDQLLETLLEKNWRIKPVQVQVPSNSQIFGNLVAISGVQGILYPSKLTEKECLAVFTQNFGSSDCYIAFDDVPPDTRVPARIDAENFSVAEKSYEEIVGGAP